VGLGHPEGAWAVPVIPLLLPPGVLMSFSGSTRLQLPPALVGKEAEPAPTHLSTHRQTAPTLIRAHGHGPSSQIRAWLAFSMAAAHPLCIIHCQRAGWLLIKVTVPPGRAVPTTQGLVLMEPCERWGRYNGHHDNPPPWSRISLTLSEDAS
jgi:hypothetical protein